MSLRMFPTLLLIVSMVLWSSAEADGLYCDLDFDGDVDRTDLTQMFALRNTPAQPGFDPADPDQDGFVTVYDIRACVNRCTLPDCSSPPSNTPPIADAGNDQTVDIGDVVTLNGSGSSDADGDALSYRWQIVLVPDGSAAALSDGSVVTPTFFADSAGDYIIELVVNDGNVDSPPDDVVVITAPGNTPPVADAGPDQTVGVFETVTLDGSGSTDVDGDSLDYFWTLVASPVGSTAELSDQNAVMPTFTSDLPGSYDFELVVNDGIDGSLPDMITVTTVNTPPVADAGPDQTVALFETVFLDGSSSSDADGDSLSYSWSITAAPVGSSAVLSGQDSVAPSFVADQAGTYVVQLVVSDGLVASSADTVTISTENTRPVADAGADQTAQEGDTVSLDGSNSSDADGDPLTYAWSFSSRPAESNAVLDNRLSVAPQFTADEAGLYVVQLIVNDGNVNSEPDTTRVTIEVLPNVDPNAVDDFVSTAEDESALFDVLANDSDADGDTLSIVSVGAASDGIASISGGLISYAPNADFNGSDQFDYTIDDGRSGTSTATVFVTVDAVNDAPSANDDITTVVEDETAVINVLANDSDPDGDVLSVAEVTQGASGSVTNNGDSVDYTPNPNFGGNDSFEYTISDGNGGSATAVVTVTVNDVNDDPIANDDAATVFEDDTVTVPVLANDSDPDGDSLTVTDVGPAANGVVSTNGASVSYSPAENFDGSDSFTYTISDGNGGSASAVVSVNVDSINDDPTAADDVATTDEDEAVTVDVLANDSDIDGDSLTIESVTQGSNGSVVNDGSTLTYTPNENFSGSDSFTYQASDGQGGTASATVDVTVTVVNDAPVANDDTAELDEDASILIPVLDNDSDVEGDSLSVASITQPVNGTVSIVGSNIEFIPNENFAGDDTFTYIASDGQDTSLPAIVTVSVLPINDPPMAVDDTASTDEDTAVVVSVLANDNDVDGDELTIVQVSQGSFGDVSTDGTAVTYTPDLNFNGDDSFSYTISDGAGGEDVASVDVTVQSVNDAPVADAGPDQSAITLDAVQLDASGSNDIDGDSLTYAWNILSGPAGAALSSTAAVAPTLTFSNPGTYVLELEVSDGFLTDVDEVVVTVSPAPVLQISDVAGVEGDVGETELLFSVSLSFAIDRTVSVQFASADGTATLADSDYAERTGSLTFAPGSTDPQVIALVVNGDTVVENDETVLLTLTSAVNATIGDAEGIGMILNDDALPTIALSPPSSNIQTLETYDLTVTLSVPAGAGGQVVLLTSSDSEIADVPASITVPAGLNQATALVSGGTRDGAATVTASAAGFTGDTSSVNVGARTLIVDVIADLIGVERNADGLVTLTDPAPAGGVDVSLVSGSAAIATVAPATVTIPEGETEAVFEVSGVASGVTDVTASAPGYEDAEDTFEVTTTVVSIGLVPLVAPEQSVSLPISISSPAPAGGVTVNLVSDDPATATVDASVFIPAGLQTPDVNPQVSGIDIGIAAVTASAVGFAPDTRDVTVSFTLELNPNPLELVQSTTENLVLSLSAPAPSGGLSLQLSSENALVADVPESVTVPAGETSVNIPVDGVAEGATTVTAGATGIDSVTADVLVTAAPAITLSGITFVGDDLQISQSARLAEAAPAGNLQLTVTSSDPSQLLVSTSGTVAGSAQINLQVSAGSVQVPTFYLQGLTDTGSATVTIEAPGYATASRVFQLRPSGFLIFQPSSIDATVFSGPRSVTIQSVALDALTLARAGSQPLRAGLSIDVALNSQDPGIIGSGVFNFIGGESLVTEGISLGGAPGSTEIVLDQPAGFQEPSNGRQRVPVTIEAPRVFITSAAMVTADEGQSRYSVKLESAPPAGESRDIVLSVPPNSNLLVSADANTAGGLTAVIPNVSDINPKSFYIQGLEETGTSAADNAPILVTPSATDYVSESVPASVTNSGFSIGSSNPLNTNVFAPDSTIGVQFVRLDFDGNVRGTASLRAGGLASVPIAVADPTIGSLSLSTLDYSGQATSRLVAFDPLAQGATSVSITQPAGFESRPRLTETIAVNVDAPDLLFNTAAAIVGEGLQNSRCVRLQTAPPSPVDITVTSSDPSRLILTDTATPTVEGTASVTFTGVSNTSNRCFYVQGIAQTLAGSVNTPVEITASAPNFNDDTMLVSVYPSAIGFLSGDLSTNVFANPSNVVLRAVFLDPNTLISRNRQFIRGRCPAVEPDCGYSLEVPVNNSNPSAGSLSSAVATFVPTNLNATLQFDPETAGTTELSVVQPSGFQVPSDTSTSITVNVDAPDLLWNTNSTVRVGENLQTFRCVRFETSPPNPVDIVVTISSESVATLQTQAASVTEGGASITFAGVTNTSQQCFVVQGRTSDGTTSIRAQAAAYNDATLNVDADPSGFYIFSPSSINLSTTSSPRNVGIRPARLDPVTLNVAQGQTIRGGFSVDVELDLDNPAVGSLSRPIVSYGPDGFTELSLFTPLAPGESILSIVTPPGFATPSNNSSIPITVTN